MRRPAPRGCVYAALAALFSAAIVYELRRRAPTPPVESAPAVPPAPAPSPEELSERERWTRTLISGKVEERVAVARAICSARPWDAEIVSLITAALRDDDARVRGSAVELLGSATWNIDVRTLPDTEELVTALKGLVEDHDADMAMKAVRVAGNLGPRAARAVESLRRRLRSEKDPSRRTSVAIALGDIGEPAGEAIPDLIEALKDQNAEVRSWACSALSDIRSHPRAARDPDEEYEQVLAAILDLLDDPDREVKKMVMICLSHLLWWRPEQRSEDLAGMLASDDRRRRVTATILHYRLPAGAPEAIPRLVSLLEDDDPCVRFAAAETLGDRLSREEVAEARLDPLLGAMRNPYADVRWVAVRHLWDGAARSPQTVVPALSQAVRDRDSGVRRLAAEMLGRGGPAAVGGAAALGEAARHDPFGAPTYIWALGCIGAGSVPVLLELMAADNEATRRGALDVLYGLLITSRRQVTGAAEVSVPVGPALQQAFGHPAFAWRALISGDLAGMGPEARFALSGIAAYLRNPPEEEHWGVYRGIRALPDLPHLAEGSVPVLTDLLAGPSDFWQAEAAQALGKIGPAAAPAVPKLRELLRHLDADIRAAATRALILIDVPGEERMAGLKAALHGPDFRNRIDAALHLWRAGQGAEELLPPLVEVWQKDPRWGGAGVMAVLSGMGPAARPALPTIREGLRHPDVCASALDALERVCVEPAELRTELLRCLDDPDFGLRLETLRALGRLHARDPGALSPLIQALSDREPGIRAEAARVLGRLGPAARPAVPGLTRLLGPPRDADAWQPAAEAMGRIGPESAESVRALVKTVEEAEPVWRDGPAGIALRGLGPEAAPAVPALIEALDSDVSRVRVCAAEGLYGIGSAAESAVPALIARLDAPEREVRQAVTRALGRIGESGRSALRSRLLHPGLDRRVEAAVGLLAGDPADAEAMKEVADVLKMPGDASGEPRYSAEYAARSLGAIAPEHPQAIVTALAGGLSDLLPATAECAEALSRYGRAASGALPLLTATIQRARDLVGTNFYARDWCDDVVASSARAIGEIATPGDREAVQALEELQRTGSGYFTDGVREAAVALEKIGRR